MQSIWLAGLLVLCLPCAGGAAEDAQGRVYVSAADLARSLKQYVAMEANPGSRWDPIDLKFAYLSAGFVKGLAIALATEEDSGVLFPSGVNLGQLARVVIGYVDARPERLHVSAEVIIREALLDAFGPKVEPIPLNGGR